MNLLISNDDGIDSPGIRALAAAAEPFGTTWVSAPNRERSAQSHTLTLHKPLRAIQERERWWAVSGTPADCVYLGIHELMPQRPDLVLSGINKGSNLGSDVFYSGTVAAAMEAVIQGVPAIAFSLHLEEAIKPEFWETSQIVVARVLKWALSQRLPSRLLLNVNIPPVAPDQLRGLKTTVLGERSYGKGVDSRLDPRGKRYYWIGGEHEAFSPIPDSDGPALEQGWATITPIEPDLTKHDYLDALRGFTDE